jgi:hypothetical protein
MSRFKQVRVGCRHSTPLCQCSRASRVSSRTAAKQQGANVEGEVQDETMSDGFTLLVDYEAATIVDVLSKGFSREASGASTWVRSSGLICRRG